MEPPPCVQNAMMKQTKKPFTYTPGGIDLSEIKSPRMARRIERNANYSGNPEPAPTRAAPSGPLPPSALAAMQPQMQVQVFPSGPPPSGPNKGASAPPPPPPPPANIPPPPPLQPLPTQKVTMGDNQVVERPDMTKIIPDNPMALLRKTGGPQVKKSFVDEMYSNVANPNQPPTPPTREMVTSPRAQPQTQQRWVPPQQQPQPQQQQQSPPAAGQQRWGQQQQQPQQQSPPIQPPTPQAYQQTTAQPWSPSAYQPQQQEPPRYQPKIIERNNQPAQQDQPLKTSTAHLGSLYIPPINNNNNQPERGFANSPPQPPRRVDSPQVQSPSTPTLKEAPKPWQKQAKQSEEIPPWAKRDDDVVSPPRQQVLSQSNNVSNNGRARNQQQQPPRSASPDNAENHPNAVYVTQPLVFQHPGPGPNRQPIPVQVGGRGPATPATPGSDRSLNRQQSWSANNPTQSNAFKIIQKITQTDNDDEDEEDAPVTEHGPRFPQQFPHQQVAPSEQIRQMKLQAANADRDLLSRFHRQGGNNRCGIRNKGYRIKKANKALIALLGIGEIIQEEDPRYRGGVIPSRVFRILDESDEEVSLHNNEVDPRYRGSAIPSKAFKLLQSMTDGTSSASAHPDSNNVPQSVAPGNPGNKAPQVRTIPIQIERDDEPPRNYVHPSQQTVPEPKKYTGSSIPSRSFKILQAMTADTCANANEVYENENDDPSSWGYASNPNNYPPYPYPPFNPYFYPANPQDSSDSGGDPRQTPFWGGYYPPYPPPPQAEPAGRNTPLPYWRYPPPYYPPSTEVPQFWGGYYPTCPTPSPRVKSNDNGRHTPLPRSATPQPFVGGRRASLGGGGDYCDPRGTPVPFAGGRRTSLGGGGECDPRRTPVPFWGYPPNNEDGYYPYPYYDPYYYYYGYGYPPPMYPYYGSEDTEEPQKPQEPVKVKKDSSESEAETETEVEDSAEDTKSNSFVGLQAIRSVNNINIFNDKSEEVPEMTMPTLVQEMSDSDEEDSDSSSSSVVYENENEEETIPHQLSVIFEESERTNTTTKREASVLSDSTTVAEEDDGETISFSIPLKISVDNTEETNGEIYASFTLKSPSLTPNRDRSLCRLSNEEESDEESVIETPEVKEETKGEEVEEEEDWWGILAKDDDLPPRRVVKVEDLQQEPQEESSCTTSFGDSRRRPSSVENLPREDSSSSTNSSHSPGRPSNVENLPREESSSSNSSSHSPRRPSSVENLPREESPSSTNSSHSPKRPVTVKDCPQEESSSSTSSSDSSSSESEEEPTEEPPREPEEDGKPPSIQDRIKALKDSIERKRDLFKSEDIDEIRPLKERYVTKSEDSDENRPSKPKDIEHHVAEEDEEEEEEEEGDSGVTSDISRHISDSEEFPELKKMTRYQRAATHSRLFKLLQEECDDDEDDYEASVQVKTIVITEQEDKFSKLSVRKRMMEQQQQQQTLTTRRDQLSLPLTLKNSSDESFSSSGLTSPGSPVNDKLVTELVQSMLKRKKGQVFRNMPKEKLQAAAKRILQEEMDYSSTTTPDSAFLSPLRGHNFNDTESSTPQTPQEFLYNYDDYKEYYDSWSLDPNYDILPSKAFKLLQEHSSSVGSNKTIAGFLARCPKVLSSKNVPKMIQNPKSPDPDHPIEPGDVSSAS